MARARPPATGAGNVHTFMILLPPEELMGLAAEQFGGKALGLLRLATAGVPVPPWLLLTAEAAQARAWEAETHAAEFRAAFLALSAPPFAGIMVRSSAPDEDAAHHSQAGRYHSEWVGRPEALSDALSRVVESATGGRIAVILQAGIAAELSGVLFSAHPAAPRLDQAYVEVVYGKADALVGGDANPTRVHLDYPTGSIEQCEAGADGPPGLSEELARALCSALRQVEASFTVALDVEWVYAAHTLWLVQARPITALGSAPGHVPRQCATAWFMDQRFLEPVHPITWTTLVPLIVRTGFQPVLEARGETEVTPYLHRYGGIPYVSHELYAALLGPVPRWLLTEELRQLVPRACSCKRRRFHLASLWPLLRRIGEPLGNIWHWNRFQKAIENQLELIPEVAASTTLSTDQDAGGDTYFESWQAAWEACDRLSIEFLKIHRWSIVLADYWFAWYRWRNGLLPTSWAARRERRLLQDLRIPTREANQLRDRVVSGEAGLQERAAFIQQFGQRSESLDYATPTWAEQYGADALPMQRPSAPACPPTATRRHHGLKRLLEMREEQRLAWEKILARQRHLLLEAAGHLNRLGVLCEEAEIWWMEWEELCTALRDGISPCIDKIAQRQHAMRVERLLETPRFVGAEMRTPTGSRPQLSGRPQLLHGVGASPGRASGRALPIPAAGGLSIPASEPVIAVLAALHPAQSHLIPRVAGLVVERGGLLSHAAVLAREYGVPLVIGVPEARTQLPPGARLTIDGSRGTVEWEEMRDGIC